MVVYKSVVDLEIPPLGERERGISMYDVPGPWWVRTKNPEDGRPSALVRCPNAGCGWILQLRPHSIDAAGKVTPTRARARGAGATRPLGPGTARMPPPTPALAAR